MKGHLQAFERSPSISSEKTSLNFAPSFPLHRPPIDLDNDDDDICHCRDHPLTREHYHVCIIEGKSVPDAGVEEDAFQHRSQLVLRFALELGYNSIWDKVGLGYMVGMHYCLDTITFTLQLR